MKQKSRNIYWMIAGIINLFTAILHIVGGQLDLVNPLLESDLSHPTKTQWLGAWHIVSVILVVSSYYLLKYGSNANQSSSEAIVRLFGMLYLLFAGAFIASSLWMNVFAPQWILLLPIGILSLIGSLIKRK